MTKTFENMLPSTKVQGVFIDVLVADWEGDPTPDIETYVWYLCTTDRTGGISWELDQFDWSGCTGVTESPYPTPAAALFAGIQAALVVTT